MSDWRVYYGDGSTFSNEDGGPEFAPALDVQAIVQPVHDEYEPGRHVLSGRDGLRDYYVWLGDEHQSWDIVDSFGMWDYLQRPGWKRILLGRTIPTARFREILYRATHDPDFRDLATPPPREEWGC